MLYLVATPIGNLQDITLRALDVLRESDCILCEDTTHTKKLLSHFSISTPTESVHQWNEEKKLSSLLDRLRAGQTLSLVSDAGTPLISDPGFILVRACHEADLPVTALPGPSSVIQALALSGLPTHRFQFMGFLPRKEGEKQRTLLDSLLYPGTTIFFETPHRLLSTLKTVSQIAPQCVLVIARELTKRYEEIRRGTAQELLSHWSEIAPKGEIVLLLEGNPQWEQQWSKQSPQERVLHIQELFALPQKEAIKIVASLLDIPKKDLYNSFIDHD